MDYILVYVLLAIIAVCLIVIIVFLYKNSKMKSYNLDNSKQTETSATADIPIAIPSSYSIDNDKLPYKTNKAYGWGREYNVFITKNGKHFHRSKCKQIRNKARTLIHRYNAIKNGYIQCKICKPRSYIDDWYIKVFPSSEYTQGKKNTYKQMSLLD